jgi:hypothetical protein
MSPIQAQNFGLGHGCSGSIAGGSLVCRICLSPLIHPPPPPTDGTLDMELTQYYIGHVHIQLLYTPRLQNQKKKWPPEDDDALAGAAGHCDA